MKKLFFTFFIVLLPMVAFAVKPDQCALHSTCSFSISGKFNKILRTSGIKAGRKYICRIVRGKGKLLSLRDVHVTKGVSYDLKGSRLNRPFIIYGPRKGTGTIYYTLHNHNDPWRTDNFQFKCVSVSRGR